MTWCCICSCPFLGTTLLKMWVYYEPDAHIDAVSVPRTRCRGWSSKVLRATIYTLKSNKCVQRSDLLSLFLTNIQMRRTQCCRYSEHEPECVSETTAVDVSHRVDTPNPCWWPRSCQRPTWKAYACQWHDKRIIRVVTTASNHKWLRDSLKVQFEWKQTNFDLRYAHTVTNPEPKCS